jgi:hypothetical protein
MKTLYMTILAAALASGSAAPAIRRGPATKRGAASARQHGAQRP